VTAQELFTTEVTYALSHTTGQSPAHSINWNAGTWHPYATEVTLATHSSDHERGTAHAVMPLQVEIAYIWKTKHHWQWAKCYKSTRAQKSLFLYFCSNFANTAPLVSGF